MSDTLRKALDAYTAPLGTSQQTCVLTLSVWGPSTECVRRRATAAQTILDDASELLTKAEVREALRGAITPEHHSDEHDEIWRQAGEKDAVQCVAEALGIDGGDHE